MYKIFFIALLGFASASHARQPPQEALDACQSLSTGDSCSVNTPHGELAGSCQTPPQQKQLACVPSNGQSKKNPPRR